MQSAYLSEVEEKFLSTIKKTPDCFLYRDQDNITGQSFESKYFSSAQVLKQSLNGNDQLTVKTFPHTWSPEPVYVFKLSTNKKGVSEGYIDVIPVLKNYNIQYGPNWKNKKDAPEWMTLLSLQYLYVDLVGNKEVDDFVDMATTTYSTYLFSTLDNNNKDSSKDIISEIQQFYKTLLKNM